MPSRPTEGSFVSGLRCSVSGAELDPEREWNLSPSGAPILVDYDLQQVRGSVDRDEVSVRPPGMWRFRELMPLPFQFAPVSLGEGDERQPEQQGDGKQVHSRSSAPGFSSRSSSSAVDCVTSQ